jgi:hypothetical protein
MRDENPGGRPRKYASDAERQAAYRGRWATIAVRAESRTKETLQLIAKTCDASEADIVSAALKFYALNFAGWQDGLIFGKRLPTVQDKAYAAKREREAGNRAFLEGDDDGNT